MLKTNHTFGWPAYFCTCCGKSAEELMEDPDLPCVPHLEATIVTSSDDDNFIPKMSDPKNLTLFLIEQAMGRNWLAENRSRIIEIDDTKRAFFEFLEPESDRSEDMGVLRKAWRLSYVTQCSGGLSSSESMDNLKGALHAYARQAIAEPHDDTAKLVVSWRAIPEFRNEREQVIGYARLVIAWVPGMFFAEPKPAETAQPESLSSKGLIPGSPAFVRKGLTPVDEVEFSAGPLHLQFTARIGVVSRELAFEAVPVVEGDPPEIILTLEMGGVPFSFVITKKHRYFIMAQGRDRWLAVPALAHVMNLYFDFIKEQRSESDRAYWHRREEGEREQAEHTLGRQLGRALRRTTPIVAIEDLRESPLPTMMR